MVTYFSVISAAIALTLFSSGAAHPYGIETRVPNTALLIDELPSELPGTMQTRRVFPGLSFSNPVLIVDVPDASNRLCVVRKNGLIRIFPKTVNPASEDVSSFLNISDQVLDAGEQGLLGLAFDPDYASSGEFYVYYSWNGTDPGTSRISRFTNDNPADNTVDPSSQEIVLEVSQPYTNHNGGMIAFGPDEMLYVGLGDGGSGGDPLNSGQDTTTLLGSILRIDVRSDETDPGLNYRIPTDNPFYSGGPDGPSTRKEIYAYGLRNPWRFSFDSLNGYLLAGDVGQAAREEIDSITPGGNFGWRIMEGSGCYDPPTCDPAGLVLPLADYGRSEGSSVTGGYVYYGSEVSALYGQYVYGDFASGKIWSLGYTGATVHGPHVLVSNSGLNISGFGQDASGEVYVLDYHGGGVYVLDQSSGGGGFPSRLSDIPALLAAGRGVDQTHLGIIPYKPSAALWSDGALKERFMALPELEPAGYQNRGGWDFPENSILIKNFVIPLDERDPAGSAKRAETRLLYRKNGLWHGFSYEWDDSGSDARLLLTGKTKTFNITDKNGLPVILSYLYPSRSQCIQCHTRVANGVLGLTTAQLNVDYLYPASQVTDNQLRTLDHIGLFTPSLPADPDLLPRMPDPADTSASLQRRARAYLASNCSMCHQPGGPAPTHIDLRWEVVNSRMNAVDVPPGNGDFNLDGALIISTGRVDDSVLLLRMTLRDGLFQMPPLATSRVDQDAIALLRQWIAQIKRPSLDAVRLLLLSGD
ncbi:PQQ-dependent sugar dehydrogenase [Desulfosarcina alkanivorans]|nr:PQQ-dependent sugar dehydrogenase [Desulfosarcina alkanivorans]